MDVALIAKEDPEGLEFEVGACARNVCELARPARLVIREDRCSYTGEVAISDPDASYRTEDRKWLVELKAR